MVQLRIETLQDIETEIDQILKSRSVHEQGWIDQVQLQLVASYLPV